jgi:membrane protease YdiL (CAAX protease family)
MHFALFVTGLLWLFAARSVAGHVAQAAAIRGGLPLLEAPLEQALLVVLLAGGFAVLSWIGTRQGSLRGANALPKRATIGREFGRGAALGWAMVLAAMLPLVLLGDIAPSFFLTSTLLGRTVVSLLTALLASFVAELAFRGFLYQRLTSAIGSVSATFLLCLLYAFAAMTHANATAFAFITAFLFGLLYSIAWQRTHALWLGWGLHFAWVAALGVLFGLPVGGNGSYGTVVSSSTHGFGFLTGTDYGPEASIVTALVICVAIPVLYRVTRAYAWDYTHPEIVAAGYAMEIAPPAAHAAMEKEPAPAPLVQIAPATPGGASTLGAANDLLRERGESTES